MKNINQLNTEAERFNTEYRKKHKLPLKGKVGKDHEAKLVKAVINHLNKYAMKKEAISWCPICTKRKEILNEKGECSSGGHSVYMVTDYKI